MITEQGTRPQCKQCNLRPCANNGTSKLGFQKWKKKCKSCDTGKLYRAFKKDRCENCSFVPLHPCQLDVDHIDGNHKNNDPSNFRTLCANCHRLKTFMNQEFVNHK